MPKASAISLIVIFTIGGIVLGNLYGRRDIANSRPPTVTGSLGNPSAITIDDSGVQVVMLRDGAQINGAASVIKNAKQVLVNLSTSRSGKFKLVLLNRDGSPVAELTSFNLNGSTRVRANLPRFEPGDYLAVLPDEGGAPILVSDKFE